MFYSKTIFNITLLFSLCFSIKAQNKVPLTEQDKHSLEGIIVEKYYVATDKDIADTTGGALPNNAVTYRIYVDLKPGYKLQAIYGVPKHDMFIKTTSQFYNHRKGETTGTDIDDKSLNENNYALDSWITMGGATKRHFGILLKEDTDGSFIKKDALNKTDGLQEGFIYKVAYFGLDLSFFNNAKNASSYFSNNGSWAILGGVSGPTEENKILIAQLTTNGKLAFELNIQVGTPTKGVVNFVAKNPEEQEIKFDALTFQSK
jgi:hypothetical protein